MPVLTHVPCQRCVTDGSFIASGSDREAIAGGFRDSMILLLDSLDRHAGLGGTTFGSAFWNAFYGLRPGHDTGEVRIFVRVERTSIRTIRLPL